MTQVTLDSNIYISALVFGGKPMRLLEMAAEGAIRVAISDAILAEVQPHPPDQVWLVCGARRGRDRNHRHDHRANRTD